MLLNRTLWKSTVLFRRLILSNIPREIEQNTIDNSRNIALLTTCSYNCHKISRKDDQIKAPMMLLIDENGVNLGNKVRSDALDIANSKGLKLVEVAPFAKPFPVCRLISSKQLFIDRNKRKEKSKPEILEKEYRIKHNISQHDLIYRIKQIEKYLDRKYRIKLFVKYKSDYNKAIALVHSIHEELLRVNPKILITKPEHRGERAFYCYLKLSDD